MKPSKSPHYETRFVLTLAGFLATETSRREGEVGPYRPRPRDVRYTITDAGREALDAANCDHRSSRCARCTTATNRA